jgi:hypothetical protein
MRIAQATAVARHPMIFSRRERADARAVLVAQLEAVPTGRVADRLRGWVEVLDETVDLPECACALCQSRACHEPRPHRRCYCGLNIGGCKPRPNA